ncbi:MAG: hypothetical protein WC375_03980 [Methanomassiliicoccales archaeon]
MMTKIDAPARTSIRVPCASIGQKEAPSRHSDDGPCDRTSQALPKSISAQHLKVRVHLT